MPGLTCDVCGKSDLPTEVCSSRLGAISFAYCEVCHAMGAEPRAIVEGSVELASGLKNIREEVQLTYYDQLKDSYIDVREGPQNIILKDGREFATRAELLETLKK